MSSGYVAGQVLTAKELNTSFDEKVDSDNAEVTGGFLEGLDHVYVIGTTPSTSPTTGAVVIAGGVGVSGNVQIGGALFAAGNSTFTATTATTSATTGAVVVSGGVGVGGNLYSAGTITGRNITTTGTTSQITAVGTNEATSAATGSIVVSGGVGVAKSIFVAGGATVQGASSVGGVGLSSGIVTTAELTLTAGGSVAFPDGSTQSTAGAINGEMSISTTGGTTTVTAAQAAANSIFIVSGALASNATITMPATPKVFTASNQTTNASFSLTIKASGQTPSVTIGQGKSMTLYSDATGVYATSAASGMQFSGQILDSTGQTLNATAVGQIVYQTASAITTTIPAANTYPAGTGFALKNVAAAATSFATQNGDTTDQPRTSLQPRDTVYFVSNGASIWRTAWYSNEQSPTYNSIKFADGTTQSTANGTTMPVSTSYSVALGNVTAGASSVTTSGYVAPFVTVYRNGLKQINGDTWSYAGDGKTINLTDPISANDLFEILTNVVNTPTTAYAPSSQFFTPAAGATGIAVSYTVGFVRVYKNGSRLVPTQDFTATDGANINFVGFTADGLSGFEVEILTPMTYANAVSQSNPTLSNPLTFADGSKQGTAVPGRNRLINAAMRISQRGTQTHAANSVGNSAADRWYVSTAGAATTTDNSWTLAALGAQGLHAVGASGNTGISLGQKIESLFIGDLASKQVTLTGYYWSTSARTPTLGVYTATAKDNFTSVSWATGMPALPSTSGGVWTYFSVNFTIPANAALGLGLEIQFGGVTSGDVAISGLQLEQGGSPTPFEQVHAAEDLVRCQRYFYLGLPFGTVMNFSAYASNAYLSFHAKLPVSMRAVPTVGAYLPNTTFALCGLVSVDGPTRDGFRMLLQANSINNNCNVAFNATTDWFSASAEL